MCNSDQTERQLMLTNYINDENISRWLCENNSTVCSSKYDCEQLSYLIHSVIEDGDRNAYLIWSTVEGHRLGTNSCVVTRSYTEWIDKER